MGIGLLAVLLAVAGAAHAAPAPAAPAAAGEDIISDQGEGYSRSTSTMLSPTTPGEDERAEAEASLSRDLGPVQDPEPAPPPAPAPVREVEQAELIDALDAPDTGRIIRGRGGHDHVERPGGGLILDGEGRRLEILPVKNRLVEIPPQPKAPDDIDETLARLRALTAAGAAASLLLTAWLWRRKDA